MFYKFIEHSNINITLYETQRHVRKINKNLDVNVYKNE